MQVYVHLSCIDPLILTTISAAQVIGASTYQWLWLLATCCLQGTVSVFLTKQQQATTLHEANTQTLVRLLQHVDESISTSRHSEHVYEEGDEIKLSATDSFTSSLSQPQKTVCSIAVGSWRLASAEASFSAASHLKRWAVLITGEIIVIVLLAIPEVAYVLLQVVQTTLKIRYNCCCGRTHRANP